MYVSIIFLKEVAKSSKAGAAVYFKIFLSITLMALTAEKLFKYTRTVALAVEPFEFPLF